MERAFALFMNRMRLTNPSSISISLALLATLAGCAASDETGPMPGEVRSSLQRNTAPVVADADKTAVVADNATFASQFYQQLAAKSAAENLVFSPHSISTALAMAFAGADGTTATEMASALRFGLGQEKVHTAFNWLDLQISSRGKGASGKDGQPFRLKVNNALFGQQSLAFEKPFLDTLALNYDAGVQTVDFAKDAEGARSRINNWTADKTENKIKDLMPPGSVSGATRLVLVNTIYMNAGWQKKFETDATRSDSFAAPGGTQNVPTMHGTIPAKYADVAGNIAVELPFEGGEVAMTLVLPKADLATFDAQVQGGQLKTITDALAQHEVTVSLPKFKLEPDTISVKSELDALGMKKAFSGDAEFAKITKAEKLFISDVRHKAFIDVEEGGVEAAAATAVSFDRTSAVPDPAKVVNFNRPFFFGIRDVKSGAWLFLGHVVKPQG